MDFYIVFFCHFVYEQLVCGLLKMRSNQFMEFNCWADYMACKSDRKCGKMVEGNLFSHDNSLIWSKYVPLPITEIPFKFNMKINTHFTGENDR